MTTSSNTESRYRLFLERFPVRKFVLILLAIVIAYGAAAGSIATLQLGRFSSEVWINLFISGVARGSVYAIIALGYTLVYGILFIINFAHGEVFMAGAFTAYFVAIGLDQAGMLVSSPIISIALLFLVSRRP